MSTSTLPEPHEFISSLFTALSSPDPPNPPAVGPGHSSAPQPHHIQQTAPTTQSSTDPLSIPAIPSRALHESPNTKQILTTLHCLFPQAFLGALDVLDRRLIVHSAASPKGHSTPPSDDSPTKGDQPSAPPQPSHSESQNEIINSTASTARIASTASTVHYVRSTQGSGRGRGRVSVPERSDSANVTYHEVRLGAWNCTCAAFAFAALGESSEQEDQLDEDRPLENHPSSENHSSENHPSENRPSSESRPFSENRPPSDSVQHTQQRWDQLDWSHGRLAFGGSRLVSAKRAPPTCKHLLACCLLRSWPLVAQAGPDATMSAEEAVGWAAGWR